MTSIRSYIDSAELGTEQYMFGGLPRGATLGLPRNSACLAQIHQNQHHCKCLLTPPLCLVLLRAAAGERQLALLGSALAHVIMQYTQSNSSHNSNSS